MTGEWLYLGENTVSKDHYLRLPPAVFEVTELSPDTDSVFVFPDEDTGYLVISTHPSEAAVEASDVDQIRKDTVNINERRLSFTQRFTPEDPELPAEVVITEFESRHFAGPEKMLGSDGHQCYILTNDQLAELPSSIWISEWENIRRMRENEADLLLTGGQSRIDVDLTSLEPFLDLTPGDFPGQKIAIVPFEGTNHFFDLEAQEAEGYGRVGTPQTFNEGWERYQEEVGEGDNAVMHYPGLSEATITIWWDPCATTYAEIDQWRIRTEGDDIPHVKKECHALASEERSAQWGVTLPKLGAYYLEVEGKVMDYPYRGETWIANFSRLRDQDDDLSRGRLGEDVDDWNAVYAREIEDVIFVFVPCVPWEDGPKSDIHWFWDFQNPIGVYLHPV